MLEALAEQDVVRLEPVSGEPFYQAFLPRPEWWGGRRIRFRFIQFWQGHPFRLHDRIEYRPQEGRGWAVQLLYP